ncbi:hypothetical protein PHYPO_G00098630 [Pangasianodon hypophthalmus]|uniref:Uncharacterized protein n=1 Tax=Pangasianodon hypophthalmus TaxID=310915 RepID=A0A5N5LBY3_PANHP|nr:hypothetical protein PHYPO_G00098630 [Pangasianodon hypophthalmus]
MESASEVQPCSSRKHPQTPAGSQLYGDVQTETCTASGGGTSGNEGQITPAGHEHVKKEEPEGEATSGSVGHIAPVDQQKHVKKEEPEDNICGGTSNSLQNLDQQNGRFQMKHVKEEESEDEDYLCTPG